MTRVELRIDELVVTGPDPRAARHVVAALEGELRRGLERTPPATVAAGGDRREVLVPDARLARGAGPERTGEAIAAQVGGALGWW